MNYSIVKLVSFICVFSLVLCYLSTCGLVLIYSRSLKFAGVFEYDEVTDTRLQLLVLVGANQIKSFIVLAVLRRGLAPGQQSSEETVATLFQYD